MKQTYQAIGILAVLLMPGIAFAAGPTDLFQVLKIIGDLVMAATPVVAALALLGFFWGLAIYLTGFSGDEKEKKKGRDIMVYGIFTLFVMFSVQGLIGILQETFDVHSGGSLTPPTIPNIYKPPTP